MAFGRPSARASDACIVTRFAAPIFVPLKDVIAAPLFSPLIGPLSALALLTGSLATSIAPGGIATAFAGPADQADPASRKAQRRAALLQEISKAQAELSALDADEAAAPPLKTVPEAERKATMKSGIQEVLVRGKATGLLNHPTGQTVTTVGREQFKNTPAFNIGQVLQYSPGVTVQEGNGPRDVSISIRGSNERQAYGIRNIQVFEDGFPVTQPDGLARADLTDPHAYERVDVVQGPSSALYGDFATGGAIDFITRPGGTIGGAEFGSDAGSYGYLNNYLSIGDRGESYEYGLFGSHARQNGATQHESYNTTTENILAIYQPTAADKFTLKFINNDMDANLPIRLSLNQFLANPYQQGCAALAAAGCASARIYVNGVSGAQVSLSPDQAGLGRHDRRTILGARWEHTIDTDTSIKTQFVFDNRDINQPTSALSYRGTYPSFNFMTTLIHDDQILGIPISGLLGFSFNYEDVNSYTYNLTAAGGASLGAITQTVLGHDYDIGARARLEAALTSTLKGTIGLGVEYTDLAALQTSYAYGAGGASLGNIAADRNFFNAAPEAALLYTPDRNWQVHLRVGTGYGTPQVTNLFTTPQGTAGNNTQLQPQTNVGVDLGAEVTLADALKASVTGFYEFFSNELVTQAPGANLMSYTFNAPASVHRGVEIALNWRPLRLSVPGLLFTTSYTFDNQIYSQYKEQLSAGKYLSAFDRADNKIPGVFPNFVTARLAYTLPSGLFEGLGGFAEVNYRDGFYLDNANLVQAPAYHLVNLELHYTPTLSLGLIKSASIYVEIQNLLNQTYVGSASNISDSISSTTGLQNGAGTLAAATGSIYAGMPRSVFGGLRVKF